jgi:hypothetical protein
MVRAMKGERWMRDLVLGACAVALCAVVAGCGGGSKSPAAASTGEGLGAPPTAGTHAKGSSAPGGVSASASQSTPAVAYVSDAPIAVTTYQHWLAVENALGGTTSPSHEALAFLITSRWMLDEAAARGITVSAGAVRHRFDEVVHQSFSKSGSLRAFMAKSHQNETDLLERIKVELLRARIAAKITAGQGAAQSKATLARFEKSFHQHWKVRTKCKTAYVMEDCSEYKGGTETLTTSGASSKGSSSSAPPSGSSSSKAPAASSSGEVYSPPNTFAISSSAFERNGEMPSQYTCAGAGASPPLSWTKVPAKAVELVLFIIDDSASNASGGIRWVVAGIDPKSSGVAAGQLPAGGIVGTNTAGHAEYSAICPAHGKSDTIEFVLYALSKQIALSPGFQPSVAEGDYGRGKSVIGSAINYAVASRP